MLVWNIFRTSSAKENGMTFRRSDLQEAFFVPGTHAFRVWGYGTSDALEEILQARYFEPVHTRLRGRAHLCERTAAAERGNRPRGHGHSDGVAGGGPRRRARAGQRPPRPGLRPDRRAGPGRADARRPAGGRRAPGDATQTRAWPPTRQPEQETGAWLPGRPPRPARSSARSARSS
jgi:hypothetical protein